MKENDDLERMLISIGAVIIGLGAYAWVTQAWWAWFLTPHGLGTISFAQALVLRFAVALLTTRPQFLASRPKAPLVDHICNMAAWAVAAPAMAWCLGWAFKTWLPL